MVPHLVSSLCQVATPCERHQVIAVVLVPHFQLIHYQDDYYISSKPHMNTFHIKVIIINLVGTIFQVYVNLVPHQVNTVCHVGTTL